MHLATENACSPELFNEQTSKQVGGKKKSPGRNGVVKICKSSRGTGGCTKDTETGPHVQRFITGYST